MANPEDIDRWKKGKDHWNEWAEGRLKAKEKLKKEGKWEVDDRGEGANAQTKHWIASATVDFSEHVFTENADFSNCIFPHTVRVSEAKFKKDAVFYGAHFKGDAGFRGAHFEANAGFGGAHFEADAWFVGAHFKGYAGFGWAHFKGDAGFDRTHFKRYAGFSEAHFKGYADFGGAHFEADVGFDRAHFEGDAGFDRAHFKGYAGFAQCTFDGNTVFNDAEFNAGASFNSAISNGPFSLADTKFRQVPDFIQMSFRASARLDDLEVIQAKAFQISGDRERAARYRALKKITIESHDHVREQDFFVSELRERRGTDDPILSPRYILSFIYEALSDFGTSLQRPLAWLFGTWLVMAAAYGTWVPKAFLQACGWTTTWMAPEHYLSLLHTLPFVGLVRSGRRELALKCLYGSKTGFGAGTDVAFIAHNTFAAVLIFLFFLAMRNHFKIK